MRCHRARQVLLNALIHCSADREHRVLMVCPSEIEPEIGPQIDLQIEAERATRQCML